MSKIHCSYAHLPSITQLLTITLHRPVCLCGFSTYRKSCFIRVDNADLWNEGNHYHLPVIINGISKFILAVLFYITFYNHRAKSKTIKKYLTDILIAPLLPADRAKDLIYNLDLVHAYSNNVLDSNSVRKILSKVSEQFTTKVQQTVGNCVVASHNISMEIRINKNSEVAEQEPFTWIKRLETRTSATADPQIGII
ncbi:hypothetical protein [Candidatus Protochlamydia amoebophila]|uniref:hypothetical protein n=1 Tax=Candidatus Protochlamydia amoebophila TaxID=362787 RepID=UPI001BCA3FB4|nr:hypothetical protein [Candidatus Protochlamydia amoebophila]